MDKRGPRRLQTLFHGIVGSWLACPDKEDRPLCPGERSDTGQDKPGLTLMPRRASMEKMPNSAAESG